MAVKDVRGTVQKQRVEIVTCDPSTRTVEGRLRDGGLIRIAVWEIPPAFRWPKVGEVWTVCYDRGYWTLESRTHVSPDGQAPIEDRDPGHMVLDAEVIVNSRGEAVISDLYYLHDQMVPAAVWLVTHNLGKYPSVTVVDSTGAEVETQVEHVDMNTTRITQTAPFGGRAFFS